MDNIFKLAEDEVKNPGLITRAWHSGKLHGTRSAVNSPGSFGSKLIKSIGTAGRAVVGCIPLPLAGGLISVFEKAIEGKIRSYIHEKKRDKLTVNLHTHVKFALKELSVENLDRYRFKHDLTITDLNKAVANHNANLDKYFEAGKPCQAFWELALAIAAAERRSARLREACEELHALMEMTMYMVQKSYTGQELIFPESFSIGNVLPNSIVGIKKNVIEQYVAFVNAEVQQAGNYNPAQGAHDRVGQFAEPLTMAIGKHASGTKAGFLQIRGEHNAAAPAQHLPNVAHHGSQTEGVHAQEYIDAYHDSCGGWCCFADLKDPSKGVERWRTFKNGLSKVTSTLTSPSLTDFVSGISLPSGGAKTAFNWGEN